MRHAWLAALLAAAVLGGCGFGPKVRSQAAAQLRCAEDAVEVTDVTRPNPGDSAVFRAVGCGQMHFYECLRGVYGDPLCSLCAMDPAEGAVCAGYRDGGR